MGVNKPYEQGMPEFADIVYPGPTKEEQERNEALLQQYAYEKYPDAMTGYGGQNLQQIAVLDRHPAIRTRAGGRGNYKAGMAKLPDGTLVLASCRMKRVGRERKPIFHITVYASQDQGLHWVPINENQLTGKEPTMACLPDGTLVLTAQGSMVSGTEDAARYSHPVSRSRDGGRTWETFALLGNRDYPRNLVVEPDGTLLMVRAERFRFWFEDRMPEGSPHLEVARSRDGGETWEKWIGLVDWDFTGYMEVSPVRLPDGTLLAALRRQPLGTMGEGFEDTVLTRSTDGGATWCKPWRISGTGEVHFHMAVLPDGRLLGTYSNYHLPYGVEAAVSGDGGETWDRSRTIQLSISSDVYCGWAVSIPLADGSIITSYASTTYYHQRPNRTTCETVRWHMPSVLRK